VVATLVLGTVAVVHPIEITDFSVFAVGRIFLIMAAIFFYIFIRTGKRISVKESLFLFFLYIVFLMIELMVR
jgi:Ca2+/Na+ antiporter